MTPILGGQSITLRRYGSQSIVAMRPTWGSPTTSTIVASVQPVTGEDLQSLPEGDRVREVRKLYTTSLLQLADTATGRRADEVVINGATFEVRSVQRWPTLLAHYEALVVRVQEITS